MFELTVKDKTYKIRYGVNSFADTDLMDRVQWLIDNMNGKTAEDFDFRQMVVTLRDLLFVGCEKENPIESAVEAGNLLDDYIDEHLEDKNVVMNLFMQISEELIAQGFLGDLLKSATETDKKRVTKKQ